MKTSIVKNIITQQGAKEFSVRVNHDTGVCLLSTRDGMDYVLLDTLDRWYREIQRIYPRKKVCKCKNQYFNLCLNRYVTENNKDNLPIEIVTSCTNCGNMSRRFYRNLDYQSETEIFNEPLTMCIKPKIRYKHSEFNGFWTKDDLKQLLKFILDTLGLKVYSWYRVLPEKNQLFEEVSLIRAIDIIDEHFFLGFYFSENEILMSNVIRPNQIGKNGVWLENEIWRNNEIIELSSPLYIYGQGFAYYIEFCEKFLERGELKKKSRRFRHIIWAMESWLAENFITSRGSNCFDSKDYNDQKIDKRV